MKYPRCLVNAGDGYYTHIYGRRYQLTKADRKKIPAEKLKADAKIWAARAKPPPGPGSTVPTIMVETVADRDAAGSRPHTGAHRGQGRSVTPAVQNNRFLQVPPRTRRGAVAHLPPPATKYTPRTPQTPAEMKEEVRKMALIALPPVSPHRTNYRQVRLEPTSVPVLSYQTPAGEPGEDHTTPLASEVADVATASSVKPCDEALDLGNTRKDPMSTVKESPVLRRRNSTTCRDGRKGPCIELQHIISIADVPEFVRTIVRSGKHATIGVDIDVGLGDMVLHIEFGASI